MVAERRSRNSDPAPAMAFSSRAVLGRPNLAEELMEAVDGDLNAVHGLESVAGVGGLLAQSNTSPAGQRTPRTPVRRGAGDVLARHGFATSTLASASRGPLNSVRGFRQLGARMA